MNDKIQISQVEKLSMNELYDCYYVIAGSRHEFAENFYYEMHDGIVGNRRILITASTPRMIKGVLLGHIDNYNFNTTAEIDYFFVDKTVQHQGVGTEMLRMYERAAANVHNAEMVRLKSAAGAVDFYKSRGYLRVGSGYLMQKILTK